MEVTNFHLLATLIYLCSWQRLKLKPERPEGFQLKPVRKTGCRFKVSTKGADG